MFEYRLYSTGQIVSEDEYKALHPNVSFAEDFVPADADRVYPCEPPEVGQFQRAVRNGAKRVRGRLIQDWKLENWSPVEISGYQQRAAEEARAAAKAERASRLKLLVVSVGDKMFNADDESQNRMLRKVYSMEKSEQTVAQWTLADNRRVDVTLTELRAALTAAEAAQSSIWKI